MVLQQRVAVGSNPALDSLVAVRNSSPGRPEPCEGNLVAAAGRPLLEISLSDFRRLATLNIYTYLHRQRRIIVGKMASYRKRRFWNNDELERFQRCYFQN